MSHAVWTTSFKIGTNLIVISSFYGWFCNRVIAVWMVLMWGLHKTVLWSSMLFRSDCWFSAYMNPLSVIGASRNLRGIKTCSMSCLVNSSVSVFPQFSPINLWYWELASDSACLTTRNWLWAKRDSSSVKLPLALKKSLFGAFRPIYSIIKY